MAVGECVIKISFIGNKPKLELKLLSGGLFPVCIMSGLQM